ncbi:hypothetical protein [Zavarzinella formosa]|uniref:hypothetical protein n=1 Tax=Zavarzinella formosa TaxID=360055 RepID=UPI000378A9AA|nr:hypothetical protein [Zavarzinella formosa]
MFGEQRLNRAEIFTAKDQSRQLMYQYVGKTAHLLGNIPQCLINREVSARELMKRREHAVSASHPSLADVMAMVAGLSL